MDATEKKVIKSICTSLIESAKSEFEEGDVRTWANFAKRMRATIDSVTPILSDLINDDDKPNTTTDTNLKL